VGGTGAASGEGVGVRGGDSEMGSEVVGCSAAGWAVGVSWLTVAGSGGAGLLWPLVLWGCCGPGGPAVRLTGGDAG
jgi:hypothetical protein